MVGIYKITSPTDKIYIGQSWDIEKRFASYRNRGCNGQPKLSASFKKHGFVNHKCEVIHELPIDVSQDVLNNYEILFIASHADCGIEMMNLRKGGEQGGKLSEESKQKIREARKRQVISPEVYKLIALKRTGIKRGATPESVRRKQSLARMGKEPWNKGKTGLLSDEVRKQISDKLKGHKQNPEQLEARRRTMRALGYWK